MPNAISLSVALGRRRITIGALACAFVLSSLPAIADTVEYVITVNTAPLIGNSNAPYYADFQFNSGGGPFANTATVSNFTFGGGSPSAPGSAIVYNGNPTGDLGTSFSLIADPSGNSGTSAFNEIAQQFTPGTTLSFHVTLSENGGVHAPDGFFFAIDDSSTFPIATNSPDGNSLAILSINLAFSVPAVSAATYSPTDPQYSGLSVSVTPTPLPAALPLFAGGLSALGLLRWCRRRAARSFSA